MDVGGLIQSMVDAGAFSQIINDPLAQFGPPDAPFLGAEFLPEVTKEENTFTEVGVRYRSPVANHGTRYSPVQIKGGMITGQFEVSLGYSDIGAQMFGKEYDLFVKLLRRTTGRQGVLGGGVSIPADVQALAAMLKWVDLSLVRPMHMRNEIDRWSAIINASVVMHGDNGYTETVTYPNPAGHRVHAGFTWSNDANDPMDDINAMAEFLLNKGYKLKALIIGNDVRSILSNNDKMRLKAGRLSVLDSVVTGVKGRLTEAALNTILDADGLPPYTRYDRQYFDTTNGPNYIFPRGTMAFLCETGRDEEIDRGDLEPVVKHDTLGYVGVGVAASSSTPGMQMNVRLEDPNTKNEHMEGEAWQASLPVITDPEAVAVIDNIA